MSEEKKKETKINNNLLIAVVATFIIAGAGGFFAGMNYQQSKLPQFARNMSGDFQDRTGLNQDRAGQGMRPVDGEIISLDEESITHNPDGKAEDKGVPEHLDV